MSIIKEMPLRTLIKNLDLPDLAYQKANDRYEDLGKWFNRDNSILKNNGIHVYPQGSFMLGTAIRPINSNDEYDLDIVSKIEHDVSKRTHTQKNIKELIGYELEAYRKARGIKEKLESKNRCWRLNYHDDISFHIDIVPAIPADEVSKEEIYNVLHELYTNTNSDLPRQISDLAIFITDDRDPNYETITDHWNISNPKGYGIWFKNMMRNIQKQTLMVKAQVDKLPMYKQKTPLQRCIQLLKRHRDIMFRNNESKPISIIITTLAARAYNGESDIFTALINILQKMPSMINKSKPRVPNPVKPEEDFADKWDMPKYAHLNLEKNFYIWIQQALNDFKTIQTTTDPEILYSKFKSSFGVTVSEDIIKSNIKFNKTLYDDTDRKSTTHIIKSPAKPWRE